MKLPKNILTRSSALLKMATKVGFDQVRGKIENLDIKEKLDLQKKQALTIVETLGRMKGAAMKVGQLLSLDSSEFLPDEMRKLFEPLQNSSPFSIPFETVKNILEERFPDRYQELENLSEKALAAASIGQVHAAQFKGQDIVLKVQYPGIAQCIDSDLNILQKLLSTMIFVKKKNINLESFFSELSSNLHLEVDYVNEALNLKKYQKNMPENEYWSYPKLIEEFCCHDVISFERLNFPTVTEWLKSRPSLEERSKIAHSLIQVYLDEFYRHGFVQTDPNPSNFLVDPERCRVVLIDFGAVKNYSEEFIETYRSFVASVRKKDRAEYLEKAYNFKLIDPREDEACQDVFCQMIEQSLDYFEPKLQPFDFSNKATFDLSKELTKKFVESVQYSPPPAHLLLLHRKMGGLYFLLRNLDVRLDLAHYLDAVFEEEVSAEKE